MFKQSSKYKSYLENILTNKVNHGKHIKMLCEQIKSELDNEDSPYYFDYAVADRYLKFIENLSLTESEWAGKPFILENWQAFAVANIFGWKRKENGLRRFDEVTIHIPKKNGKTALAAVIAIAYAFLEKEDYAGQIYMAATNREQANICFRAVKRTIDLTKGLGNYFKVMQYAVINKSNQTNIKALSGDAPSVEGFGSSLVIFDEYHLQRDDELKENLITGQAARKGGLFISISTAGTDKTSPYFRHIKACKNILNGFSDVQSHLVILYEADSKDWRKESTWKQANPNYGVSVLPDKMHKEFKEAVEQSHKQPSFITKHLNIWADSSKTWIDSKKWEALAKPLILSDYYGKEAFIGIDGAVSGDFSAVCIAIPDENRANVKLFFKYYIPEEMAEKRSRADGLKFKQWEREGFITLTEGDATDLNVIIRDIVSICGNLDYKPIAYDTAWLTLFATTLYNDYNIEMKPFSQSVFKQVVPTNQFYEWVMKGNIEHDGNPITAWMLSNVEMRKPDDNGNTKVSKGKSKNKIDGIAAAINAIGRMLEYWEENPEFTNYAFNLEL